MDIHHYIHWVDKRHPADSVMLHAIRGMIECAVKHLKDQMMVDFMEVNTKLDALIASEADESSTLVTLATSVTTLLANDAALKQQLADALAGATIPPEVLTKIDTLKAASDANTQAVKAAVASIVI